MIRPYKESDLPKFQEIHKSRGFNYELPNFSDDIFLSKVVSEENGEPGAGIFVRITAEAYLLSNNSGTPVERWQRFKALHGAVCIDLIRRGLQDVHCWVPPSIEKSFGRRLCELGWQKALWPCYVLSLEVPWLAVTRGK